MIEVNFEYPGLKGQQGEHPGQFTRMISDLARVPAIGEALLFEDHFVGRVTWVLWRTDGQGPELHVEVQEGHTLPKRGQLEAAGWEES